MLFEKDKPGNTVYLNRTFCQEVKNGIYAQARNEQNSEQKHSKFKTIHLFLKKRENIQEYAITFNHFIIYH